MGESVGTNGGKAVVMGKICKSPKLNPETINMSSLREKSEDSKSKSRRSLKYMQNRKIRVKNHVQKPKILIVNSGF